MTIRTFNKALSVAAICLVAAACSPDAEVCDKNQGVTLQILGSGGPIADDARASSGYLVWDDGRSRVVIDAGGGVFLRFGEAGASFEDLDFIGLSHLHTDHSADFPALVKSGNFSNRQRALAIAGPGGEGIFPGLKAWLRVMLHRDGGAYGYLGAFLTGTDGSPMLAQREIVGSDIAIAYRSDDLEVEALRVPHSIVPATAFRVTIGDESLVFASDQNGNDPAFVDFAAGASVLVMHMAVPEDVQGVGRRLHAPPSVIGDIAARAAPGKLVLSHFMARSLRDIDDNVALVRERYKGDIVLAEDLACVRP